MEIDAFYGVTLTEKEPLQQFEGFDIFKEKPVTEQKLIIKQIMLGSTAKAGEFNVVQVETNISEGEGIKIPVAVLKAGETRMLKPNIEFPSSSVTFKLIQGTGPVHIHGQHVVYEVDNEGRAMQYDEDEEDDDDEEFEDENQINGKSEHKKK